jgi:6-phosphofructokinase 2
MNTTNYRIITLTFNPCIDKSTSVNGVIPDKKLKCSQPVFEPGGGGINVARAIKKLGGRAIAVYPAGGYSGKFLNELLARECIPSITVETASHTRENLIVLDESINKQFKFGMPGPELTSTEWQECLDAVEKDEAEYIVVSGSLTPGLPEDIIARIAVMAKQKNKKLLVDSSGESLKLALKRGVYLIKPNLGELMSLYGSAQRSLETAWTFAKDIVQKQESEIVIVSLGAEGALLVTQSLSIQLIPPPVKTSSTVGAGDSMVAGIVLKLSQGWQVEKAVKYGVACGTAATMNHGTELCNRLDVDRLFPEITTTEAGLLHKASDDTHQKV